MNCRERRVFRLCRSGVSSVVAAWLLGLVPGSAVRAGGAPVRLFEQEPISIAPLPTGACLFDFGKVAFGNLLLKPKPGSHAQVVVRFGESLRDGRVDRSPPGSVRYAEVSASLDGSPQTIAPPADERNTKPPAVLTSPELGVLFPFRWVEITGWTCKLQRGTVLRRAVFDSSWHDGAASFHSSDPMLDRIWSLSLYSIKATTYAGVFVDGDRERLSYEADGYLNQLGYYAGNPSSQMERDTFERLILHPTWPTEWASQMVFMAHADWMQTADKRWLAKHYAWLRTKLLLDRVGPDGLVHSTPTQVGHTDIVDWPIGERDGYIFTSVNTVVNAFYLRALDQMHEFAKVLGNDNDAEEFSRRRQEGVASFQKTLFDQHAGLYRDGAGTDHDSVHANLFPLAFGLIPEEKRLPVARWLAEQGMRCSVYAAQYLLEGLFESGEAKAALDLMTAPGDRSWRHMVDSGATITWEAWDQRYKPNQDWNHAWGAAPANLLPRFVLGVQARRPGWTEAEIAPHPGGLEFASGTVPTPRGTIQISWRRTPRFTLSVVLPKGMEAKVRLPANEDSQGVWRNGHIAAAHREGAWWVIDEDVSGTVKLEVR